MRKEVSLLTLIYFHCYAIGWECVKNSLIYYEGISLICIDSVNVGFPVSPTTTKGDHTLFYRFIDSKIVWHANPAILRDKLTVLSLELKGIFLRKPLLRDLP